MKFVTLSSRPRLRATCSKEHTISTSQGLFVSGIFHDTVINLSAYEISNEMKLIMYGMMKDAIMADTKVDNHEHLKVSAG